MDYAVGDHPTPRNFLAQAPFSGRLGLGSRSPGGGGAACNLKTFEAVKLVRVSMDKSR